MTEIGTVIYTRRTKQDSLLYSHSDVTAYVRALEAIALAAREWRDNRPGAASLPDGCDYDLRNAVDAHREHLEFT